MNGRPSTARPLLAAATAALAAAGIESPRVDAELLLAHVLGIGRGALITTGEVDAAAVQEFGRLVARRLTRQPLQYLTGEAPFRFSMLAVGPGVFIPRPETELLVDAVLPVVGAASTPIVVDLCSGSGALAVALAQEAPHAEVVAVERCESALPWLRRNTHGTGVAVVVADVADLETPGMPDLLSALDGRVTAVVSNPPYVPTSTIVGPEVEHDPYDAVFAGPDGLAVITAVVTLAARLLRPGGVLALEHDDSHGESVPVLLRRGGCWAEVLDHRDLTGRPRYVTAVRR